LRASSKGGSRQAAALILIATVVVLTLARLIGARKFQPAVRLSVGRVAAPLGFGVRAAGGRGVRTVTLAPSRSRSAPVDHNLFADRQSRS